MKHWIITVLLCCPLFLKAQSPRLSYQAEISILTVGPGSNFYDCFGHSAFRIKDPALGIDLAYNYGMFDTEEPGFYTRFSLGTQDYYLSAYDYKYFLGSYQRQNRWIKEQVLNLQPSEIQQIFEFLENNRKPENRAYRYDPYFDNCATRMRDLVVNALGDKLQFNNDHLPDGMSLRDLTDENSFNFPWWDFGVDLALGTVIDGPATPEEYMFLPDYIYLAYENATIQRDGGTVPAVKKSTLVFESDYHEQRKDFIMPWMIFAVLAVIVLFFTVRDYKRKRRARGLDFALMLLTGLCGALVIFLWFFTSHKITPNNLNILWAFLPNLVVAFYLLKKEPPNWVRVYVRFLFILLILMLFVWVLRIQVFGTAMIPFMLLLAVRYGYLWQRGLVKN